MPYDEESERRFEDRTCLAQERDVVMTDELKKGLAEINEKLDLLRRTL